MYFGSFQDLLGRDKAGNIKPKNEWVHATNWDLVVFDEYHFGAWRDSAKELFEGEDDAEAKKELGRVQPRSRGFNEELDDSGEKETEFLPITTKAYLYLSGTPFKALATGSSSRSRSSTGPTPMSSARRRIGRESTQTSATRTQPCRR